jgi:ankyrin repeat protein
VELLLTRASVNYNNGEVFIYAIRNFRVEIFHLLLGQGISHKSLSTAIQEALKAPTSDRKLVFSDLLSRLQPDHLNTALKHVVMEKETDLAMARMLLDSGADAGHEDGVCIKHAASTLNRDLLRLLSEHLGHHGSIYSHALAAIINCGKQWVAFEHVEVIDILLQHGASGPIVGKALVELVDHLACQQSRAGLAETLLRNLFATNADVNHENGKVICIAASRGDSRILPLLLANGAASSSATLALTAAIMAHHEESTLLQLIDIFSDTRYSCPDFDKSIPGLPPPIFQCLKSYGRSTAVLESLVNAGCRLETTVPMNVFSPTMQDREERVVSSELEPASVLMWALLQEEGVISPAVLDALVLHGGKSIPLPPYLFFHFSDEPSRRLLHVSKVSHDAPFAGSEVGTGGHRPHVDQIRGESLRQRYLGALGSFLCFSRWECRSGQAPIREQARR